MIHNHWVTQAILLTYLDKPLHTQKHPEPWFQVLTGVDSEHAKVYRGALGFSPELTGFAE